MSFPRPNFRIKKNQVTIIAGRSGSGKTTLINILTGLLEVKKNLILIDNVDINDILYQWEVNSEELFHKTFLHIPCQSIDFPNYNNPLKMLTTDNILKYIQTFYTIVNMDILYQPHLLLPSLYTGVSTVVLVYLL